VALPSTAPGDVRRPLAVASTVELVLRWRDHHDERAREELCERFLPMARRLAGRYRTPHEPFEDLVQVASVGLLGAIDRFDPARGPHFASFAIPTILGELKRHFRNTGWSVHVPRGAQEMAQRVDRAAQEISSRTGQAPRVQELAAYLEMAVEDVLAGLEAGSAHFAGSLDVPIAGADSDEPQTLADRLGGDDDRFALVDAKLSLTAAITQLPYLERRALSLRIDGDMKQVEIARELGCSQMQVSRLLRSASARVRGLTDPDLLAGPPVI
jgi:RNA polymerase sigma-B factor